MLFVWQTAAVHLFILSAEAFVWLLSVFAVVFAGEVYAGA